MSNIGLITSTNGCEECISSWRTPRKSVSPPTTWFCSSGDSTKVCKLNKSIYGLKNHLEDGLRNLVTFNKHEDSKEANQITQFSLRK